MRTRVFSFVVIAYLALPDTAGADVYKFKKPDGTVVYTDNLAQLPPDRREHYNKIREEREQKRQELERQIGKEELQRREAEAQRAELERASLAEAERTERIKALEETIQQIQTSRKTRETARDVWRTRMLQARKNLDTKLAEFAAATEKHNSIAIQPDYARFPGAAEELEKAKNSLVQLEKEIDELVRQVDEVIPEEARKAGVPPGWLR